MYKLIFKYNNTIVKSYDIYTLWKFIVSNPYKEYEFYIGYKKISQENFLIKFLYEADCYLDYIFLRNAFIKRKTIKEYAEARRIIS